MNIGEPTTGIDKRFCSTAGRGMTRILNAKNAASVGGAFGLRQVVDQARITPA